MNLLESCVNKKCKIVSINMCESLKEHLHAIGIYPNETIYVKRYGWFKSSVQIQIGQRLIALGRHQACAIEVCSI